MKKICFLHTDPRILSLVRSALAHISVKADIECLPVPSPGDIPEYAGRAVREGASVLVSWALDAAILRNRTDYAVVEIGMTGPEFLGLIQEARGLVQKKLPLIAFVGCAGGYDAASVQELMGVRIAEYPVEYRIEEAGNPDRAEDVLMSFVDEAVQKGADCVAGGKAVCDYASRLGVANLPVCPGAASVAGALYAAHRICSALEAEKRKAAELKAVVDNSGNGIVRLDEAGKIVFLNYAAEKLLGASFAALEGKTLSGVMNIPREDCDPEAILLSGKSCRAVLIRHGGLLLAGDFTPVTIGNSAGSVIVTLRELQKIENDHSNLYRKLYIDTFSASGTFGQLVAHSSVMATAVKQAGVYARYDTPILITGEIGSGKKAIAQCIHNASTRHGGPFAAVDCSTMPPEALDSLLYGTNESGREHAGLLRIANDGTLYLGNVCSLDMYAQQKLAGVLSDNTYFDPNTGHLVTLTSRVRLICAEKLGLGSQSYELVRF